MTLYKQMKELEIHLQAWDGMQLCRRYLWFLPQNYNCPCWLLNMPPHHKRYGEVTAEVMAELGWSCVRKNWVFKRVEVGLGWDVKGRRITLQLLPSPWSQSSRKAGVTGPATNQQPLAASHPCSPAASILASPGLPRDAAEGIPMSLLCPNNASSCLLPQISSRFADTQRWSPEESIFILEHL